MAGRPGSAQSSPEPLCRAEGDSLSVQGQDAARGLASWNQHCSTAAVSGAHGYFYFSIVSRQSAGICSPFHFFILSPEDAFHGEFQCFSYPHKQALLRLFSRETRHWKVTRYLGI